MKKNLIITGIILLIIAIFGVFYFANKTSNNVQSDGNIIYIDVNQLEQKIKNKDSFVLVFTQDGCSHCKSYAPVLEEVSKKYNIKIYDLNLTKVKSTDIARVNAIASISGTPTTVFYKNGEEETTLNRINGDTTSDKLIAKLQKLGYIKGE